MFLFAKILETIPRFPESFWKKNRRARGHLFYYYFGRHGRDGAFASRAGQLHPVHANTHVQTRTHTVCVCVGQAAAQAQSAFFESLVRCIPVEMYLSERVPGQDIVPVGPRPFALCIPLCMWCVCVCLCLCLCVCGFVRERVCAPLPHAVSIGIPLTQSHPRAVSPTRLLLLLPWPDPRPLHLQQGRTGPEAGGQGVEQKGQTRQGATPATTRPRSRPRRFTAPTIAPPCFIQLDPSKRGVPEQQAAAAAHEAQQQQEAAAAATEAEAAPAQQPGPEAAAPRRTGNILEAASHQELKERLKQKLSVRISHLPRVQPSRLTVCPAGDEAETQRPNTRRLGSRRWPGRVDASHRLRRPFPATHPHPPLTHAFSMRTRA